jgi:hypothetical protein
VKMRRRVLFAEADGLHVKRQQSRRKGNKKRSCWFFKAENETENGCPW